MSEALYHRIRCSSPIAASELAVLVREVEEATNQKAPATVAQKRAFLQNWAEDQKQLGHFSEPPANYKPPARSAAASPDPARQEEERQLAARQVAAAA